MGHISHKITLLLSLITAGQLWAQETDTLYLNFMDNAAGVSTNIYVSEIESEGNLYVGGNAHRGMDLDPHHIHSGDWDIIPSTLSTVNPPFIAKYRMTTENKRELVWAVIIGGRGNTRNVSSAKVSALVLDEDNHRIYFGGMMKDHGRLQNLETGYYYDFNGSHRNREPWISALSSDDGSFIWTDRPVRLFHGYEITWDAGDVRAIQPDNGGGLWVGGSVGAWNSKRDGYILRLNAANGDILWTVRYKKNSDNYIPGNANDDVALFKPMNNYIKKFIPTSSGMLAIGTAFGETLPVIRPRGQSLSYDNLNQFYVPNTGSIIYLGNADLDGDNSKDLIVATHKKVGTNNPGRIRWYKNNFSNNTSGAVDNWLTLGGEIDEQDEYFRKAIPKDMDNDGDIDIVSGWTVEDSVVVYVNNGSGVFLRQVIFHPGHTANTVDIDVVDWDGDGKLDIISTDTYNKSFGKRILLHKNTGDLTFATYELFGNTRMNLIRAADFNADSLMDIFATNLDHENEWLRNTTNDTSASYNHGLNFDGQGKVEVPFDSTINPAGSFTLEAWVKAENFGGYKTVISSRDSNLGYIIYKGSDDKWQFWTGKSYRWDILNSTVAYSPGVWTHLAVTFEASGEPDADGVYTGTKTIYVNGQLVAQASNRKYKPNYVNSVYIGSGADAGEGWKIMGNVDDVRIWNVVRTTQEIQDNMSSELAGNESGLVAYYPMKAQHGQILHDYSNNSHNGSIKGATWEGYHSFDPIYIAPINKTDRFGMADVDGDGKPDIIAPRRGVKEVRIVFNNLPQGATSISSSDTTIVDLDMSHPRGWGIAYANVDVFDYDNDDDLDIVVMTNRNNFLFKNVGNRQFERVTLNLLGRYSATGLDLDGDGTTEIIAGGENGRIRWQMDPDTLITISDPISNSTKNLNAFIHEYPLTGLSLTQRTITTGGDGAAIEISDVVAKGDTIFIVGHIYKELTISDVPMSSLAENANGSTNQTGWQFFIAALKPDFSHLFTPLIMGGGHSTYEDFAYALDVDEDDNIYVVGSTEAGTDWPIRFIDHDENTSDYSWGGSGNDVHRSFVAKWERISSNPVIYSFRWVKMFEENYSDTRKGYNPPAPVGVHTKNNIVTIAGRAYRKTNTYVNFDPDPDIIDNTHATSPVNSTGPDHMSHYIMSYYDHGLKASSINRPPTVSNATFTLLEDQTTVFSLDSLTVSDPDTVYPRSVTFTSLPDIATQGQFRLANGSELSANTAVSRKDILAGKLTFKPVADYNGTALAVYKISDGFTFSTNSDTLFILVTPVDDAPRIVGDGIPDSTTQEDAADVSINLAEYFTDVDNDNAFITYTLDSLSASNIINATISSTTLKLDFLDDKNSLDGVDLRIKATSNGKSITDVFKMIVTPIQDPPIAIASSDTVYEDTDLTLTVLGTDVDGDVLTFKITDLPQHGVLVDTATGVILQSGDIIELGKASDTSQEGNINSSFDRLIEGDNLPFKRSKIVDPPQKGVFEKPSSLTVVASKQTINAISSSQVIYRPDENYNGPDSIKFVVNDQIIDSDKSMVALTVNPVQDQPLASGNVIFIKTNRDTVFIITGTDVDGEALTTRILKISEINALFNAPEGTASNDTVRDGDDLTDQYAYYKTSSTEGRDTIRFVVFDGIEFSDTADVMITVRETNFAPVAYAGEDVTNEDTAKLIKLIGTDANEDPLSYIITTLPKHGKLKQLDNDGNVADTISVNEQLINIENKVIYVPHLNFTGVDSFAFKVFDGEKDSSAVVQFTVNPVNDKPLANSIPMVSTREDSTLTITLSGSDVDGDALNYIITTVSVHGTLYQTADGSGLDGEITTSAVVTNANHKIIYKPNSNFFGKDSLEFMVKDQEFYSDVAKVSLKIDAVNDTPTVTTFQANMKEDTDSLISLKGVDVEGDALEFKITDLPTQGKLFKMEPGRSKGDMLKSAGEVDSMLWYVPNENYFGSDSIGIVVYDGKTLSDTSFIIFSIENINDPPSAKPLVAKEVDEDSQIVLELNASDIDNSILVLTLLKEPANGKIYQMANDMTNGYVIGAGDTITHSQRYVIYAPDKHKHGADYFRFKVSDGWLSDASYVTLIINSIPDPPVANDDSVKITRGLAADFSFVNKVTDPDKDIDWNSLALVKMPKRGSYTLSTSSKQLSLDFANDIDYAGNDTLKYKICDETSLCDTANIFVSVLSGRKPTAVNDTIHVNEDADPRPVNVLANDSDLDNDINPSTLDIIQDFSGEGNNAELSAEDSTITVIFGANYYGKDSLIYAVTDSMYLTSQAMLIINVLPVNDVPVADSLVYSVQEDKEGKIQLTASDADGDSLSYFLYGTTRHGVLLTIEAKDTLKTDQPLTATEFIFKPDTNFFGLDTFYFYVKDIVSRSDTFRRFINISSVPDAPQAVDDDTTNIAEDTPQFTINVLKNDTDVENDIDTSTLKIVDDFKGTFNGQDNLAIVRNNGDIRIVLAKDFHGKDTLVYQITDATGLFSRAKLEISVYPINDPPIADSTITVSMKEDMIHTIALSGSDVDGDTLSYYIEVLPDSGRLMSTNSNNPLDVGGEILGPDFKLVYDPNSNFFGQDSFAFSVKDPDDKSDIATVSITVENVPDPPVAVADNAFITQAGIVEVNVLKNDFDVDKDLLEIKGLLIGGGLVSGGQTERGKAIAEIKGDSIIQFDYTAEFTFYGKDTLYYVIKDSLGLLDTAYVQIDVQKDVVPPKITWLNADTLVSLVKGSIKFSAEIKDEVALEFAKFKIAEGGSDNFRYEGETDTLDIKTWEISYQIESSDITERGVWIQVRTKDVNDNMVESKVKTVIVKLPADTIKTNMDGSHLKDGFQLNTWQLISIPTVLDDSTVDDVFISTFGEMDNKKWVLWKWDNEWVLPSIIKSKEGYWILQKVGDNVMLKLGAGKTAANIDTLELDVYPGWNLFGNPYLFGFKWDLNDKDIRGPVTYKSLEKDWDSFFTHIEPFGGYAIKNESVGMKRLRIPTVSVPRSEINDQPERALDWMVTIGFQVFNYHDSQNRIGLHPEAAADYDMYDFPSEPHTPDGAEALRFDWQIPKDDRRKTYLAADIRNAGDSTYVWTGILKGDLSHESITTSFDFDGEMRMDHRLVMLDLGSRQEFGVSDGFSVVLNTIPQRKLDRRIKFFYGPEDWIQTSVKEELSLIPDTYHLTQNYPNPFNPVTVIEYQIPKDERVKLAIYNILGQEVITLVDREMYAGYYSISWDGRNSMGSRVSAGTYFYLLQTHEYKGVKKMVLLK